MSHIVIFTHLHFGWVWRWSVVWKLVPIFSPACFPFPPPLLSSLPPSPHCLCMSTVSSAQVQEDNLSTCLLIYHPSWTEDWLWTMLSLDMQWNHYLYYLALIRVFALSMLWCQTSVSPLRLGNTDQNNGHTNALCGFSQHCYTIL